MAKIYPFRIFINSTTYPGKHQVKFHKEVFVHIDQAVERYKQIKNDKALKYWSVTFTITHPDLNPDQAWDYAAKAFQFWAMKNL